jgi:hypothetical protein
MLRLRQPTRKWDATSVMCRLLRHTTAAPHPGPAAPDIRPLPSGLSRPLPCSAWPGVWCHLGAMPRKRYRLLSNCPLTPLVAACYDALAQWRHDASAPECQRTNHDDIIIPTQPRTQETINPTNVTGPHHGPDQRQGSRCDYRTSAPPSQEDGQSLAALAAPGCGGSLLC